MSALYTTSALRTECSRWLARLVCLSCTVLMYLAGLWAGLPPAMAQTRADQRISPLVDTEHAGETALQEKLIRQQEERRFARLQRKGVISVQHQAGAVRITINPLLWRRLTPSQQERFLQRAQRLYQGLQIEVISTWHHEVLARLTTEGIFEFPDTLPQSLEEAPAGEPER